jgi:integrase
MMARQALPVAGIWQKNPGSGIWYIRYRYKGKLVRKRIGTRQQAIEALEKVKYLRVSGAGNVPITAKQPARTFAEERAATDGVLLSELCDGLAKQIRNDRDTYRDQYNPPRRIARIKQAFGKRQAASIRPYEIKDWLLSLTRPDGEKLSPGGRNRYKTTFSAIYSYGKEREKVSANPVREFKRENEGEGVIRYLDPAEEARLRKVLQEGVDACDPETQPVLRQRCLHRIYELDVALGTGVRRGEQYRMTWEDVNFERAEILIPKTKFGPARTVHMIRDVTAALKGLRAITLTAREWKKGAGTKVPRNFVFAIVENRTWFKRAIQRAKIKNFHWHCLRHTFISRLVQRGANLKVVQEAAGHRTITMTARYAHLNKTDVTSAMELLNRG